MKDRVSMRTLLKRRMDRSIEIRTTDDDIICGRGKHSCHHPGNVQFLKIVSYFKSLYVTSDNQAQIYITEGIIKMLKERSPPVRFVTQDVDHRGVVWYEIPYVAAIEKTRQALRKKTTPIWAKLDCSTEENEGRSSLKVPYSNSKRVLTKNTLITQNKDELQQDNYDGSSTQLHQPTSFVVDLTLEPNETFSSEVPAVVQKKDTIGREHTDITSKTKTTDQYRSTDSSKDVNSNIMSREKEISDSSKMQMFGEIRSFLASRECQLRIEREQFRLWQNRERFLNKTNEVVNGPVVMKMNGNEGKLKCSNFMYQILVESLTDENKK